MNSPSNSPLQELPLSELRERLDQIEQRICNEFPHRVHNFHIQAFNGGLVLEGRTKTYYGKQLVFQAVMTATELPILADRIVVG